MTSQEVFKFADKLTTTLEATIVNLHNGDKIVGYFNHVKIEESKVNNLWHFHSYQQFQETNGDTVINGRDILSIEIVDRSNPIYR